MSLVRVFPVMGPVVSPSHGCCLGYPLSIFIILGPLVSWLVFTTGSTLRCGSDTSSLASGSIAGRPARRPCGAFSAAWLSERITTPASARKYPDAFDTFEGLMATSREEWTRVQKQEVIRPEPFKKS